MYSKVSKKDQASIQDSILVVYNETLSSQAALDNTHKAAIMFNIFLQFIVEHNWEYFPQGNGLNEHAVLAKRSSKPCSGLITPDTFIG